MPLSRSPKIGSNETWKTEKKQLNYKSPEMIVQISQTVLLLDIHLLTNLSLRTATFSAMPLIPNIFMHFAGIPEMNVLK